MKARHSLSNACRRPVCKTDRMQGTPRACSCSMSHVRGAGSPILIADGKDMGDV